MLMIGIAGGTGSGKSTVAQAIVDELGTEHVALITQDSYYKNGPVTLAERQELNYDHPDSFDNALLLEHLVALRSGQSIRVPVYDFTTYARKLETLPLNPKPVIVVEGIHMLVEEHLRALLDIKVFVDTDPDVRVLRRLMRDIRERGRTLESVYHQYVSTVKPMHDAFIEPSKRFADLIIPEGGENQIAIELLTTRLSHVLTETTSIG
jgi:uridine kinase